MKKVLYGSAVFISLFLLLGAWRAWLPFSLVEMLGFITGGWTVWLTVKEHVWNWPIGIANSAFFLVLFLRAGLYADSGLQAVYIILGCVGWYWWLHGGAQKTALKVGHVDQKTVIVLLFLLPLITIPFSFYLRSLHDVAPVLDALTTVLSLIAQYLLTKKFLENWYVWITVDVIYIYLYIEKGLHLTAVLYVIFFLMCMRGLVEWKRTERLAYQS